MCRRGGGGVHFIAALVERLFEFLSLSTEFLFAQVKTPTPTSRFLVAYFFVRVMLVGVYLVYSDNKMFHIQRSATNHFRRQLGWFRSLIGLQGSNLSDSQSRNLENAGTCIFLSVSPS